MSDKVSIQKEMNHSENWYNFRSQGIGSSDAGVIMGFNQWATVEDLWLDKIGKGKNKSQNQAMARGVALEPSIRADIELRFDLDFPALDYQVNANFSFIRANLDGWNQENKIILECKAPNEKAHKSALEGVVPDTYWPQVQHQLLVMDCENLIYASIFNNKVAFVEVEVDLEYQAKLLQREIEFWGFVTRKEKPPENW
jgi:putative phage-type endonuclease